MTSSPSHKSSLSSINGAPPSAIGIKQERRMTVPNLPLSIPDDERRERGRPPSPLRNGYTPDDDQDDRAGEDKAWSQRSHSPSPSLTKFASNFAQRVGSLMNGMGGKPSQGLPTDAELEAEAEREREKSRKEAEWIIRQEEERRRVEDGVFALLDSMPPPPPRPLSSSPSPSPSQKEKEGWFSAVKNKLTPTKETLTPAQLVIHETKAKEKEKKKGKDKEVPGRIGSPDVFSSPISMRQPFDLPTPPRIVPSNYLPMTPSPKRPSESGSQESPPLYAQFDENGSLNVQATLLTVARRFEKLEKWTVSHVRALEDRMSNVERWLVDKEKEKDKEKDSVNSIDKATVNGNGDNDISEVREELAELQGRMGALGMEMAKLMASQAKSSSPAPAKTPVLANSAPVPPVQAPLTSTAPPALPAVVPTANAGRALPALPQTVPLGLATPRQTPVIQTRPAEPSSPPQTSSASVMSNGSRTRLPYPTGDYTSPPGVIPTKQEIMSPTNSPPPSLTKARRRPLSIAGLPSTSLYSNTSSSTSGLPRQGSPPTVRTASPVNSLTPSNASGRRPIMTSISNPRKRYTVALGGPLRPPDEDEDKLSSTSPASFSHNESDSEDEGKKRGNMIRDSSGMNSDTGDSASSRGVNNLPRVRAQSSYGPSPDRSSLSPALAPITPLRPRIRSRSTDRLGLGISSGGLTNGDAAKLFVDPLVIRKQESKSSLPKTPVTPKFTNGQRKVAVNELVAFFDGGERR